MSDDRASERGAGAVELAAAVTALLLALFFVVGALRVSTTRSDVTAAARGAARAAAASYDRAEAMAAAETVAADVLADRGVACVGLDVAVGGDHRPGGVVTATVTCSVSLEDVSLVGFGSSETVTATAVEMVDVIRGGR
ncbi:MAG: pilus assembly protein [Acidimicrobiales bacterium]